MSVHGKLLKRSALLKAREGDVLVVRYGGQSTLREARNFVDALIEAVRQSKRPGDAKIPHTIPVVFAREGVDWTLERKP